MRISEEVNIVKIKEVIMEIIIMGITKIEVKEIVIKLIVKIEVKLFGM